MAWTAGTLMHGFRVTRARESSELNGTLVEMRHEVTGSELAYLDNGENNKLFCATFKTIPEDSTGVFHILEHTVLNGSDRFPVREPFVELLKGSMNTFLNAMTFPDKTMYPVSSRNRRDFLNLVSVYLDAVFAPRLLSNPLIFRQEGWHMEKNGDELSYKGVVLNEMKGAMSDIDDIVEERMGSLLFPDTCYGFNSGGEPGCIQDLTYEKYVETYHRFYHPSNAHFYLDGQVPLDETLELIDSYLRGAGRQEPAHGIAMQAPHTASDTASYEIGQDDPSEKRTLFAMAGLLSSWEDPVPALAFKVLARYLAGSNESPLSAAVLQSGLGQDVSLSVNDNVAQPWFLLTVRGTEPEHVPALKQLITDTLRKVLEEGIDRAQLRAMLARLSYSLKEAKEPQGLIRAISMTSSWLYGGDPMLYLETDRTMASLKELTENGGIERLLKETLLEGQTVECTFVPSRELGQEMRRLEQERLTREWDALDEAGKQQVVSEQEALLAWQQTPDTPEALATIPVLPVSEIDPEPFLPPTAVTEEDSITVLRHPIPSRGIVYTTLLFDLADYSLSDLTRVTLLASLISSLPTSRLSIQDIQRELYQYTGSFNVDVSISSRHGNNAVCRPFLKVSFSALEEYLPQAQALVMELLTDTRFDARDRMRENAEQMAESARNIYTSSGHSIGRYEVLSHFSSAGAADEAIRGASFFQYVQAWPRRFDDCEPELLALAGRLVRETAVRSRMTVTVTGDERLVNACDLKPLLSALPEGTPCAREAAYTTSVPYRLGITIPAQISYAVAGAPLGTPYTGALRVLSKIVSLEYLWNAVRVQGGAYGSGLAVSPAGMVICYSYRDPSPARSLGIYRGTADFLRGFLSSASSCAKYILSAVSDTEPLLGAGAQGALADSAYFSGLGDDFFRQERGEMLKASPEGLLGFADALAAALDAPSVCVTAHQEAIGTCEGLELLSPEA